MALPSGLVSTDAERLRRRMDDMFTREPGQRGSSPANLEANGQVFDHLMRAVDAVRDDPALAPMRSRRQSDSTIPRTCAAEQ